MWLKLTQQYNVIKITEQIRKTYKSGDEGGKGKQSGEKDRKE